MKAKDLLFVALACVVLATGCQKQDEDLDLKGLKRAKYITDTDKLKMLNSLETLEKDRLYVMNYTADYKLDEVIAAQPATMQELFDVLSTQLFDIQPSAGSFSYGAKCSAYAATDKSTGNFLMGRNFDFCHSENGKEVPTTALVVFTAPKNGKKSMIVTDPYFINLKSGFYSSDTADISCLMFAPYNIMDGINEDGLAVSDLFLDGQTADQNEAGKPNIYVSVALRAILDKCGTVNEAIQFLEGYNMKMAGAVKGSLHFMLADAHGDFAVIEYSFNSASETAAGVPCQLKALKGDDAYRYVTNFYLDPILAEWENGGLSQHGRDRYNVLKSTLETYNYQLTDVRAKALLQAVSQSPNPTDPTSHTQWSSLYNLTDRSLEMAILQEYGKWYKFSLK